MNKLIPNMAIFTILFSIVIFIVAITANLLYWILVSGIFYSISCIFNSSGSFKKTMEFVGYGFLPMTAATIISAIYLYYISLTVNLSLLTQQDLTIFINDASRNNQYFILIQLINLLSVILSGYIWIFALKNARNITVKNATLVVGIPLGIYMLYNISNILGTRL